MEHIGTNEVNYKLLFISDHHYPYATLVDSRSYVLVYFFRYNIIHLRLHITCTAYVFQKI